MITSVFMFLDVCYIIDKIDKIHEIDFNDE